MKLLYVIDQKPDGYPGGIEYHQLDLIGYCVGRGIPVSLLFPEQKSLCLRSYRDGGIEETRYKGGKRDDHRLRDRETEEIFRKILSETDTDIVHFQSIRTLPLSLIETAKHAGRKVLVSIHEYYFWCINCIMLAPDFCWFEKDAKKCAECLVREVPTVTEGYIEERRQYINTLFGMIDRVITPSFYVRDVFLWLYRGLTEDKCSVIHFGVDRGILQDGKARLTRPANGILNLAFLGNFLYYKGNKAFLALADHYKYSDSLRFSIIGNIFDFGLIPSHANLSVAGGYTRNNVVRKIQKVDPDMILLFSNWPETFSYTLSEAIAAGVPVIATDGGALRERVSRESVGFLVPVENPVPRTVEIIEDLRLNPGVIDFFKERVNTARTRLKTVEDMAEEMFRIYQSLLQQTPQKN